MPAWIPTVTPVRNRRGGTGLHAPAQHHQPATQTTSDDIVGKMTIDALDREMATRENQMPPPAPVNLKVTPSFGHLLAGCDVNGFSSKRLSRTGPNAIWDLINLETPIHQMIPVGFNRSLHIEYAGSAR